MNRVLMNCLNEPVLMNCDLMNCLNEQCLNEQYLNEL